MYVVGVPVNEDDAVTVTALVYDVLPTDAVMVLVPAPTAVRVNVALVAPDAMDTLAGTVATAVFDDESVTLVAEDTAELIVTVMVWVFPGANDADVGVKEVKVAGDGVVPPVPLVPFVATNKCPM